MPFIGKQSTSNSQITNYTTTVGSGGQTNFTVVIEGGDETHVYLNGVLLKETTDYTVSSTQVSLVSPAVENDIVEIKVFRSFALVDAVKATGGTFSGDVTVPNLTLSSNVIKASDGGSTITLDDSDNVTLAGNLVIPNGGNIGSASDTDAISIASNGKPTFSAGIANTGTIDAGTFNGTIGTSATDSATSSTSVTNNSTQYLNLNPCFSASYSVYEFYLGACSPADATGVDLQMHFLTSDGNNSSADIWYANHDIHYISGDQHVVTISENTGGAMFPMHNVDSDMSRGAFIKGTIINPFSSVDNTSGHMQCGFRTEISNQSSKWAVREIHFSQETLVSCTGLRFNWSSGNWATGASHPVGKLIVKGVR